MTLVIACLSKDGMVLAADSLANYELDNTTGEKQTFEDSEKIIELGPTCAALLYGHGADNFDEQFQMFQDETDINTEHRGVIDYKYCVNNLSHFLTRVFDRKLVGSRRVVSVMIVGIDESGTYKIADFSSNRKEGRFFPHGIDTYHYGGVQDTAEDYFNKHGQEIILKIITSDGIRDIDQSAL